MDLTDRRFRFVARRGRGWLCPLPFALREVLVLLFLLVLTPAWMTGKNIVGAQQNGQGRRLTMDDGLASNAVRHIAQDRYGFVWMGTDNGLCRYDGIQVRRYAMPEDLTDPYVSAMWCADEGIYVGTVRGVLLLDAVSGRFTRLDAAGQANVTHITADHDGRLWIATMSDGVWCYDPRSGHRRHYDMAAQKGSIAQVYVTRDNQVMAVTNWAEVAVSRLNKAADRFEPVRFDGGDAGALCMLQTHDGRQWVGTWEQGLMLVDGASLRQMISPSLSGTCRHIHALSEQPDGRLLIGCDDGLLDYDVRTGEWRWVGDDRFVYSILCDQEGGLWYGTFYSGVSYVSPTAHRFDAFSRQDGQLRGHVVSRFCEDSQGHIWVASDDGGLACFDSRRQQFTDFPGSKTLADLNVHALCLDGGDLWIGTYSDGVYVMDIATGRQRHYAATDQPHSLDGNSSYCIFRDSRGQVWVATMEGVCRYRREHDDFERMKTLHALTIDIDEDRQGRLWFATQGGGLWIYDPAGGQWRHEGADGPSGVLSDNQVNSVCVGDTRIWVGTEKGLCLYDTGHGTWRRLLDGWRVSSIIDGQGALWLATDRGLVRMRGDDDLQTFTREDGLVSMQFQPNAALTASDGRIFLGTVSGFNAFYPYQIVTNSKAPRVYVTSLEIFNHAVETGARQVPQAIEHLRQVDLAYRDRMFSLSFAALSYCSPEKNRYAYRLDGFDPEWNYVEAGQKATYTNLSPGTYTFRVKATNNDGVWSEQETTLRIVVHPPFWWSLPAKILYALLLIGGVVWYVQMRLRRAETRHEQEMRRLSEAKEREAREARLNFFTMIAHEIRTPVTLIIGPLEKLMRGHDSSEELALIDRNAHRLLQLVNQLLDFRKVEQRQHTVRFMPHNVRQLLHDVAVRFEPAIRQDGKTLTVEYPDEHFTAFIDHEAITKVVSNLLSNARKYATHDIALRCWVAGDDEHFYIEVADDGKGIPAEEKERIFMPFYQASDNQPGTGIGLSIVRNIVEQHGGRVDVESEVGRGSTFRVWLPVSHPATQEEGDEAPAAVTDGNTETVAADRVDAVAAAGDRQRVLVVDDHQDMIDFIAAHLSSRYEVLTAHDGIEALDILHRQEVSLIVSDWMMPRMDGAELCRRVRSDALTSHIPFIMLTAKTDDSAKVEGMNVGADAYVEKPFSLDYLDACLRNLLLIRQRLREKFSSQPMEPVVRIAQSDTDKVFLERMTQVIEENFANPDLSVQFLAEQLAISRSGLFAKIKSLADVTPNEMIQIVRLKRAAALLGEGKYQVSEVCYRVGFSSPSYFSKCFQKQFGVKPSEFVKKNE